ncbi:MAG TPA: glucose-6-phosphate isomerase, partial [Paracoccaceae bacterium]|nr:glucose-6-phosphate isomerase [Paracoccaceae bacterium]
MIENAWTEVMRSADRLRGVSLAELFDRDPRRFGRLSFRDGDLLIDFSKEKLDADALGNLLDLARAAGIEARRDAMFRAEKINETEGRAVLHTALRGGAGDRVEVEGQDVMPEVRATLDRFLAFAEDVRQGRAASVSGAPFTDVVNLGIGGSDLGPAMAAQALAPWADGPRTHFVSNVDGAHLADTVKHLDPARTMVVVASKSFTTIETMTNARSARDWLAAALGERAGAHMAAVSTNLAATRAFDIDDARVFGFWDWVGGRYSLWSAIGLPLAIAIGEQRFRQFLAGARAMDEHFRTAPLDRNLPVLMALVGIWRRDVMGWPTVAVVPYDQRLARLPAYLQQLEMESNGKRTRLDGQPVTRPTAPIVWGEPGTNAQHSFFQLLHQGTDIVPVDFLLAARPNEDFGDHHAKLTANALAQSAALAFGRSEA